MYVLLLIIAVVLLGLYGLMAAFYRLAQYLNDAELRRLQDRRKEIRFGDVK